MANFKVQIFKGHGIQETKEGYFNIYTPEEMEITPHSFRYPDFECSSLQDAKKEIISRKKLTY